MDNSSNSLSRFRAGIAEKSATINPNSLEELELETKWLIGFHFRIPAQLRPSALTRELEALAKGLRRAAKALERMGEAGTLHILVSSHANRDAEPIDPLPHAAYLVRMARWAERAAATALEISHSKRDDKGGRTPDQRLQPVVAILIQRFQEITGLEAGHTANKETGLGESLFEIYLKEALACFCPPGVHFEPGLVDEVVENLLPASKAEWFLPPPIPSQ